MRRETSGKYQDAKDATFDSWSVARNCIYRNHVVPLRKLCVPKGHFPIPLRHVDVDRQTKTGLNVLQEKSIDDYWKVDGDLLFSDPWIGVARFMTLGPMWVGNRTTRKQISSRPEHIWPEYRSSMSNRGQLQTKEDWEKKKLHYKLQDRTDEIIIFPMLITSLMTSCTTQGESWNQEANQRLPCKKLPSQEGIESKERWFRTRRATSCKHIGKEFKSLTSSSWLQKQAAIEAQRPQEQQRQKTPRSYCRQRSFSMTYNNLVQQTYSHPASDENSCCEIGSRWRMGKVTEASSLEWS